MIFFLESVFSITVGFIGLLVAFIIIFLQKSNRYVNTYLALILFVISSKSIYLGFFQDNNLVVLGVDFNWLKILQIIVLPFPYLYLELLFKKRTQIKKRVYLHFLLPIILIVFSTFQNKFQLLAPALFYSIFSSLIISITLFYIIKNSFLFFEFFKNKNSILEKHFNQLNKWGSFFFIIFIFGSIRLVFSLYFDLERGQEGSAKISNGFKNFFLLLLCVRLLISPEILFGYPKLKEKLSGFYKDLKFNDEIWILKKVVTANLQDAKLTQLINTKIGSYLNKIEKFIIKETPFRTPNYSVYNLSIKLNIPSSHLAYIFKYHCKMSFTEYKNHYRIKDALKLINKGFLDSKTFKSLAKKVGYVSYNPFFISFKKLTNYSPKVYWSRNV
jgi:AraC-like DNA-binding protein